MSENNKRYIECKASYKLLINEEYFDKSLDEAIQEVIKDHPEVAVKDKIGMRCDIVSNKYGIYILKKTSKIKEKSMTELLKRRRIDKIIYENFYKMMINGREIDRIDEQLYEEYEKNKDYEDYKKSKEK